MSPSRPGDEVERYGSKPGLDDVPERKGMRPPSIGMGDSPSIGMGVSPSIGIGVSPSIGMGVSPSIGTGLSPPKRIGTCLVCSKLPYLLSL